MASRASNLALFGPARLEAAGGVVSMQRKSLAILYVLALDGPTRRERMAGLLWGHGRALRNLRVELHGLNRALERHGLAGFATGQNPLVLPEGIELNRSARNVDDLPLEGLEDLSRAFQGWLDAQRAHLVPSHGGGLPFRSFVDDLASDLRAPAVVIVEGLPLSGRRAFARALAVRLELPLVEGVRVGGRGLHLVRDDAPYDPALAARIVDDRRGVWVVERSAFGEDPNLVLDLRASLPADRVRYVKLPALDWHEARSALLADLPFVEAARLYMATDGRLGHLEEMLELRPAGGFGGELPLARKAVAAYQREARRLPQEARYTLERLSVQPGRIDDDLIGALGAVEHLPDLERRRWLTFDDGWRWTFETARRVVYATLQPGQRRTYHRLAADRSRSSGRVAAARFHVWSMDRGDLPLDEYVETLDPLDPFTSALVHLPAAWSPVEPDSLARGARWVDDALWWSQPLCPPAPPSIRVSVPADKTLLRLRGAVHWDAPLTCEGAPAGIRVASLTTAERDVVLSPCVDAPSRRDGDVVHPADGRFDVWLIAPGGASVEISANGAGFVAAFSVEVAVTQRLQGETAEAKEAYELARSPTRTSAQVETGAERSPPSE